MTARFTVLASGSRGNAALLQVDGFGLLIDCGLHPQVLTARLAAVGATWRSVQAVILTHTHGDHWNDRMLADLRSRHIPLWAHPDQLAYLAGVAPSYATLDRAGLTRSYRADRPHELAPGLVVRPLRVSHDSQPTFAFRIDGHDSPQAPGSPLAPDPSQARDCATAAADGPAWSLGYASDLGCWTAELVEAFAGVDVLAVEFNHDVALERASSRPRPLVQRVLGDQGHLSNDQAAAFTAAVAARSARGLPGYLVQLHLSRDCNRPELAAAAGHAALAGLNPGGEVITTSQDFVSRSLTLTRRGDPVRRRTPGNPPPAPARRPVQPRLPGLEDR
jgi:ribonuclease BN (tRNA processing enzyme)